VSDRDLRSLERRFRETGDPQDEARLLQGRVRIGELSAARLELAAYLGSPGARIATRGRYKAPAVDPEPWVRGLRARGKEVLIRVAVAAARRALPIYERWRPGDARPRQGLEAARRWCLCPCGPCSKRVEGPVRRAYTAVIEARTELGDGHQEVLCAVDAARCAVEAADPVHSFLSLKTFQVDERRASEGCVELVAKAVDFAQRAVAIAVDRGQGGTRRFVVPSLAVRAALMKRIQAEVVPWALGEVDPLEGGALAAAWDADAED